VIEVKAGDHTRHIGVISLPTFYQDFDARRRGDADYKSATRDVEKLLGELKKDKVDGVIVDLRNNGGGSLAEATDLTGLFIDKGPVVQVRNASGQVEEEEDPHPGMAWDGPLAVLVNRASASASEIFAAAIQDYGRGVIIGEPTFGKGTVQNLVDLDELARNEKPEYGEVKMTIAQFFRINGGSTQLRGVTPDISFPLTVDATEFGESSYDNALPWTSIAPAHYQAVADLKPIVPMLVERHDTRVAQNTEWQNFAAEIADARQMRSEKTVSLNEQARRKQRDEEEAKRKARETASATPAVDPAVKTQQKIMQDSKAGAPSGTPSNANASVLAEDGSPASQDDGLQPDERGIQTDIKREQAAKEKRDVVLDEAAHILADEISLIRTDTKLAARVLPRGVIMPTEVD
jgi:carboxyl-terminal processing protease